jgi:hypothetical protein
MKRNRFIGGAAILVTWIACAPDQLAEITPALSNWQIQTVDSVGRVGEYSSLALDALGNPVISYFADDAGDLKLAHCGSVNCGGTNSVQLVDVPGLVGVQSSLVIDANGNPVISYFDSGDGALKLARCGNPDCSAGNTIERVDTGGPRIRVVGLYSSIALDSAGNPVISYYDASNDDLKLVHCGSPDCSVDNLIQVVDSVGDVGLHTSLVLDSSGNPVISYYDNTNVDLKLVHCGSTDCSAGNSIQVVDGTGLVGRYTSLELDTSGNPIISYTDFTNRDLKLARCGNADCSSVASLQSVDTVGEVGTFTSLELSSVGNPVIAYFDDTARAVKLAQCGSNDCSAGNTFWSIEEFVIPMRGEDISLALDNLGSPVVSYYDPFNADLKVARLVTTPGDITPPVITPTVAGVVGNSDWYTSDVSVSWAVVDEESPISGTTGREAVAITTDTAGVTITCEATSDGGTASRSVSIKRDGCGSSATEESRPISRS